MTEIDNNKKYDAEVVLWSNECIFNEEILKSFPNLKLFINVGHNDKILKLNFSKEN